MRSLSLVRQHKARLLKNSVLNLCRCPSLTGHLASPWKMRWTFWGRCYLAPRRERRSLTLFNRKSQTVSWVTAFWPPILPPPHPPPFLLLLSSPSSFLPSFVGGFLAVCV